MICKHQHCLEYATRGIYCDKHFEANNIRREPGIVQSFWSLFRRKDRETGIRYFNIEVPMPPVKSNKISEKEGAMTEEKFNEVIAGLRQQVMNECENFGAFAPMMKQVMTTAIDAATSSCQSGGCTDDSEDSRVAALEQQVKDMQSRLYKIELEKMMRQPSCWPYESPMYTPWFEVFPNLQQTFTISRFREHEHYTIQ